jgi:hypothetical protein
MESLQRSFEDVAALCERHLEARHGWQLGLAFGALIRAYGRLATSPSVLAGAERAATVQQLTAEADGLLRDFTRKFQAAYSWEGPKIGLVLPPSQRTTAAFDTSTGSLVRLITNPIGQRTNMVYDPGPRPKK